MLAVLGYIALIYCVGALITFIPLAFIHGGKNDTLGIGLMISAGMAFFWPVIVPTMIKYKLYDIKVRNKNGKNRN